MPSFNKADNNIFFYYEDAGDDSILAPPPQGGRSVLYPHKIYLNSEDHRHMVCSFDTGWRHALVKSGVAYVITDEGEDDGVTWLVSERWAIKSHVKGGAL